MDSPNFRYLRGDEQPRPSSNRSTQLLMIGGIVVLTVLTFAFFQRGSGGAGSLSAAPATPRDNRLVTKDVFRKIRTGMHERQLRELFGRAGDSMTTDEEARMAGEVKRLRWERTGPNHAFVIVLDKDGLVLTKWDELRSQEEMQRVNWQNYDRIRVGMPRADVETLLGEPLWERDTLSTRDLEWAGQPGAPNICVGFHEDKVTAKRQRVRPGPPAVRSPREASSGS